ncbi:MAG TPA: DUF1800 domain-containing protein [Aquabacterium sp.]|uniref:DUF1800 domain-containing protein n=1 Tax=Aquabacterium sp. TaxID=1872578 RepID=UPI002E321EF4|nr:DUF1800 domain-containing protein [Aquabacterium sp.]HEX5356335.1 DUF1800 domain-containing protein [Aquabacterium sp.]
MSDIRENAPEQRDAGAGSALPMSRAAGVAALMVGTSALTACGGGGGGQSAPATAAPSTSDQPVPLADNEAASRFLSQAGLCATPDDITALVAGKLDYRAWLNAQFAKPARSANAIRPEDRTAWQLGHDLGLTSDFKRYQGSDYGLDNVLWFRLFTADDVLRQRVTLALSEIFVVSVRNMPIPWGQFACLAYWDLLESHCFGTFRQLIEAVTLSPAMGVYLSMRGSRKGDDASGRRPDENYARELLQLFTIGLYLLNQDGTLARDGQGQPIETYTNDDITQLAKVMTGWDMDSPRVPAYDDNTTPDYTARPMVAQGELHDATAKTIFAGKPYAIQVQAGAATPADELKQVLDGICAHPNVAPFLARQLIQRLVCSNPEPLHVSRVAQVFKDTGGDLKAVITAVLTDPLARDPLTGNAAVRRCKLREPMLRFVQWGRLARIRSTDGLWGVGDLSASDRLGQSPLRSPSVFNFFRPGYVPLNSGVSADGFVAPEFQITDESTVIGYANFMLRHMDGAPEVNIAVDYQDWLAYAPDAKQLVDQLNLVLTGRALAQVTVDVIVNAIQSLPAATAADQAVRVKAAFFLMLTSPDYMVQR